MEYRRLPKGTEQISVLGFGGSSIHQAGEKEGVDTITAAMEHGINYFDMAVSEAVAFDYYRTAFAGNRNWVYLQMHFGADYSSGKYGWTTDLNRIKRGMDWLLDKLNTDYIDFGFIHCIDELSDLKNYINSGALEHIQNLKAQGVARHIGLSSHTPEIVNRLLDMGVLDVVMFSINPAYDYRHGDYAIGGVDERLKLYQRCQKEQVGITVMKPFGGGQLLCGALSPFKRALTEIQCIQYALDKPGVLNVLPGYRSRSDLDRALAYLDAAPEERDYSALGSFAPAEAEGKCVYCSHCHPCPKGLDIALINKYYDLAKIGDSLAADHYRKLELHADDCIHCGHCDKRCPFHAKQGERMDEIAKYFGTAVGVR
ncbi:aldo/keto reductase [Enterocloster clostridioformis]|uniref:aldo/keto reductase n=1 Tax=Enterocloster clostridioformis TaxID=1531 RepID=UPI00267653FA|nr:aldo/keto reductase [Enterocloster clostridioformis]